MARENGGIIREQVRALNKKTNADRIRSMSDEELATLFNEYNNWRQVCPDFIGRVDCNEDCLKCWLDWLKQEVET